MAEDLTKLSGFVTDLKRVWGTDRKDRELAWNKAYDAMVGDVNSEYWGTWKKGEGEGWRSKYFPMLIKTKVVSAWAIICDTILQGGEIPFDLEALDQDSPKPDLMKKRMQGQLTVCKGDRELMKSIYSMAMYGIGYLMSPVVRTKSRLGYDKVDFSPDYYEGDRSQFQRYEPSIKKIEYAAIQYVSCWNLFVDPETDNLQEGYGLVHREMLSPYDLRQFVGVAGFSKDALNQVISGSASKFGGETQNLPPSMRNITDRKRTIEYLMYWGRCPRKYLLDYQEREGTNSLARNFEFDESQEDGDEVEVMMGVANDKVVRLMHNPLGFRPYHQAVWEVMLDSVQGRGLADNLEHDQLIEIGLMRAAIDNMGLAGNVMAAGKSDHFLNGLPKFKPGSWSELSSDCDKVEQAFQQIIVQDVSGGILSLHEVVQRSADENANLPKMISGETTPNRSESTAFEVDQRMQNAGKYLGSVIRNIDEGLIEPAIAAMYHYNMMEPGAQGEQGNFEVKPNGFSGFQNRFMRTQSMKQMLALTLSNPGMAAEVKIRPHLEEIYKGHDLRPELMLKTDEEKAQEQAPAQQAQQQQQEMMMRDFESKINKMMADASLSMARMQKTLADAQATLTDVNANRALLGMPPVTNLSEPPPPGQASPPPEAPGEQPGASPQPEATGGAPAGIEMPPGTGNPPPGMIPAGTGEAPAQLPTDSTGGAPIGI